MSDKWMVRGNHYGADRALTFDDRTTKVRHLVPERADTMPAVYFTLAVGANIIKIGMVADMRFVQRRIDTLQRDCPNQLKVLLTVPGFGRTEEAKLHRFYKPLQYHSEWFRCEGALKRLLQIAAVEGDDAARAIIFSHIC